MAVAHKERGRRGLAHEELNRSVVFVILDTRELDLIFDSEKTK